MAAEHVCLQAACSRDWSLPAELILGAGGMGKKNGAVANRERRRRRYTNL